MAVFPSGSGLLDTPSDWTDVGYGWGVTGRTVAEMMEGTRRECGVPAGWQRDAMLAGHREGVRDLAEHLRDMAARADEPVAPAYDQLPF